MIVKTKRNIFYLKDEKYNIGGGEKRVSDSARLSRYSDYHHDGWKFKYKSQVTRNKELYVGLGRDIFYQLKYIRFFSVSGNLPNNVINV